jgi:hypothetical protein
MTARRISLIFIFALLNRVRSECIEGDCLHGKCTEGKCACERFFIPEDNCTDSWTVHYPMWQTAYVAYL